MSIIKPRQYGEPIHEDAPGFNPTIHKDLVEELNGVLEVVAPQQYTQASVASAGESSFTPTHPFVLGSGGSLTYVGGRVELTALPAGWWTSEAPYEVYAGGLRCSTSSGGANFATFGGTPRTARFHYSVDIAITADNSGQDYRHPGLFIQTADGQATGFRLAHLSNRWYFTRYDNNVEDPTSAVSMNTTSATALTVNGPAVRIVVSGDLEAGYVEGWANDVFIGRITLTGGFSAARLGFFNYRCVSTYQNIVYDTVPVTVRDAGTVDLSGVGVIQSVTSSLSAVNTDMEVSLGDGVWQPASALQALLPAGSYGQGTLRVRHQMSAQTSAAVLRNWNVTVVGLKLSADPPVGYPLVHTPLGALQAQLQALTDRIAALEAVQ